MDKKQPEPGNQRFIFINGLMLIYKAVVTDLIHKSY